MLKQGLFITFEGPEGSGKTTHSKLLCGFLRKKGFKVLHTREPGGTLISEKIRKILLDPKNKGMDVGCEMLLYMAARAQIVKEKILPGLEQRKIVVCDRFTDATLAYQGYAGGMDLKVIDNIAGIVTKGLKPDMTFLLDIDARLGLLRAGRAKDRMERKSILYHNKVRNGYLSIAKKDPKRVKVLSSTGEIGQVQKEIRKAALKICH
ncbi:MAG: dTMP kinase [Omnitrophica bacterium GWA2_41_15]|nr:MAG: dTMP kinase [Omnitrophica bacterium GWA2_41_15]HAZ10248.1 dTMP kinase [Candidatus Omnitrophota bacterium]